MLGRVAHRNTLPLMVSLLHQPGGRHYITPQIACTPNMQGYMPIACWLVIFSVMDGNQMVYIYKLFVFTIVHFTSQITVRSNL